MNTSPPAKRVKLEPSSPTTQQETFNNAENQDPEYQCSICLQEIVDRTVIPTCFHEFCFECLVVWSEQSRRCPLCSQALGEYLLHNIRSKYDFRKHYLAPLRTSPIVERTSMYSEAGRRPRTARERERERRLREEREATDILARSIDKRRWIYQHDLYAKHVASNSYTRYRPYPTPAQFAASNDLISKTTTFLRRELQVWDDLDVEFLTTFTISVMKSIDIRSESAVKLLAEFLDMDAPYVEGGRHLNAEHFAHEVYSFVRSPFRDLFVYDTAVQYDSVNESPPPEQRSRRWHSIARSPSNSQSHSSPRPHSRSSNSRSLSRERSISWSPSGRHYPSSRHSQLNRDPRSPRQRTERGRDRDNSEDDERRVSRNATTSPIDTCGTSRRHIEAVKGKEHAESAFEINLPNAGKASVAQPSFEFETAAPPPPIRPSTARPPRSGHRSLLQSVQTHLKQGANYHHVGGFKGTGSERHRDALLLAHDSASPPALLARSLGVTSASGARREKRGSDFTASTLSQSIAIRHPEPPSDNEIHIPTSQPTKVSSVEMIARAQRRMAPTASEPRVSETKKNLSSPAPPSNNDRDVPGGSAVLRTRGMVELPLNLKTAAHSELNPTISPPTTPSVGDRATTPPSQFHALPTSNSSENLSHHEAAADIHHMGISQQDNTINGLRPSKSAHANIEISDSTHEPASSGSRKKLLARLQSERLHARGEEKGSAALASTGSDRTSQFAGVDRRGSSSPQSEQISNTSVVDPHVVEAKLRRRAQLQVRLAAEKRRTYI